ncbi:MAG: peroxiredoxin, partial [Prevotella sp.]|nr:peroxiredoxin [Prevotella sp.]
MQVGERAPEILGHDENGNEIRLSDFAGKKLVLYFYPKDMTSGCPAEACNLRDNIGALAEAGYAVLGASVDDAKS